MVNMVLCLFIEVKKTEFPYRIKVKSIDQEVTLPSLLWTKHNFVYDSLFIGVLKHHLRMIMIVKN